MPFPVHVHMLRHACGYAMANAGHDTRLIQDWLGHRAIQHTARYTELSPTRFRDVWVGAALTGILWRLAFDAFSWYIASNSRLAFIQGSIAAVVVFLLWIYVSSVILMYGVEFTAAYARLRRHRPDEMPAAPTPRV